MALASLQGTWESESAENYDKFLSAMGVNAIKRGMVTKMTTTLTITPMGDKKMKVKTVTGPKTKERELPIGSHFDDEGPSGGKISGSWNIEGDMMVGNFKGEKGKNLKMTRHIVGGKLHQVMNFDGTECTRVFKKK